MASLYWYGPQVSSGLIWEQHMLYHQIKSCPLSCQELSLYQSLTQVLTILCCGNRNEACLTDFNVVMWSSHCICFPIYNKYHNPLLAIYHVISFWYLDRLMSVPDRLSKLWPWNKKTQFCDKEYGSVTWHLVQSSLTNMTKRQIKSPRKKSNWYNQNIQEDKPFFWVGQGWVSKYLMVRIVDIILIS